MFELISGKNSKNKDKLVDDESGLIEKTNNPLYGKDKDGCLVVWNKLKRWGDENDRLFYIHSNSYGGKGWLYSGEVFALIPIESKGLELFPIPHQYATDIPENQILNLHSFYEMVGRKGKSLDDI